MLEDLKQFLCWWRRSKNPVTVTVETQKRIQMLFQPPDWVQVVDLLERYCSKNLPLLHNFEAPQLERIHFAALKLSDGEIDKLAHAIQMAQNDWRNLLVAAGFDAIGVHAKWIPAGGKQKR